jgi:glycogen operon protein
MLLGGDELSRTKRGNNNAYCQDNDVTWYDWDLNEDEQAFLEYTRTVLAFRRKHPTLRRRSFLTGDAGPDGCKDVAWIHPDGREMADHDWAQRDRTSLGMLLCSAGYHEVDAHGRIGHDVSVLVVFQGRSPEPFTLPEMRVGERWRVAFSSDGQPAGEEYLPGETLPEAVDGLTVLEGVEGPPS